MYVRMVDSMYGWRHLRMQQSSDNKGSQIIITAMDMLPGHGTVSIGVCIRRVLFSLVVGSHQEEGRPACSGGSFQPNAPIITNCR